MSRRFHRFEFDAGNFSFVKVRTKFVHLLKWFAQFAVMAVGFIVVSYLLFAAFFNTDTERKLRREIRMYEKIYPQMASRQALVDDAVASLQHKDDEIYELVFHSKAPVSNPMESPAVLSASDTIPQSHLDSYARDKADSLLGRAADVDSAFARIFRALSDKNTVIPPMMLPLKDISYPQVGASVGRKMNPFYKAEVSHDGVDLIVSRGTPVYAAGGGIVAGIRYSRSDGHTVEIDHPGGYRTVYKHLDNSVAWVGQVVRAGDRIGSVGMSGKVFAPHLHYEVRRGERVLDPVDHFFASVSPLDYANMLYMGVNTGQSMD